MSRSAGPRDPQPAEVWRDVVVVGGGCYGSFYARQLALARAAGRFVCRDVIVVDRDPRCAAAGAGLPEPRARLVAAEWGEFLDGFLRRPPPPPGDPDDAIVPSPLMPHLMADWLAREAGRRWPGRPVRWRPLLEPVGTPYDRRGGEGTRFVSFADWLCPTHCVEPHLCPVTRGPRTWEMGEAITAYAARLARTGPVAGPALFVTRHRAFGVGAFEVAAARAAAALLAEAGRPGTPVTVLAATVSACHGAVTALELGAAAPA